MGKRIMTFVREHKKMMQRLFQLLVLALTFFVVYEELRQIEISELRELVTDITLGHAVFIAVAGVGAFAVNVVYDLLFARAFHFDLRKARMIEVGFISQAFNGFIGFGGAAGAALRTRFYGQNHIPAKDAVKMSFGISWMSLIGLFVIAFASSIGVVFQDPILFRLILLIFLLAMLLYFFGEKWPIRLLKNEFSPLTYLTQRDRLRLLVASTFEWLAAASFFTYTIRIYQSDVGWLLALLVFSIGTVIGFLSFVPGGLGTFEGACFIVFRRLGYSAPHLALSLLIGRLAYTILPWLIAVLFFGWEWLRERRASRSGK